MSGFRPILLMLLILIVGCGGGTSGSGLKVYEGQVASTEGSPLSGVLVTVENTGDSTLTDQNGLFVLSTLAPGAMVNFLLESPQFRSTFSIPNETGDDSRVRVEVKVDTESDTVEVQHYSLRAKVAGLCDYYFENRDVIRQANRVPPSTVCAMEVRLLGDGAPLMHVPVALQYAACAPGSVWETLATSRTGSAAHAGSAEINFVFEDSPSHCHYRVVAPFRDDGNHAVEFPLETFTAQGREVKQGSR